MPSALLELVSRGSEDNFITGNPQFSHFYKIHRHHTRFSHEIIPIQWDGTADFGQILTTKIPHKGDLVGAIFVRFVVPAIPQSPDIIDLSERNLPLNEFYSDYTKICYTNSLGNALIDEISVEIGDQTIDRVTGMWLDIWSNYFIPEEKRSVYNTMVAKFPFVPGFAPFLNQPSYLQSAGGIGQDIFFLDGENCELFVPVPFWFCGEYENAFPLIALQGQDMRVRMKVRPFVETMFKCFQPLFETNIFTNVHELHLKEAELYVTYYHLDNDERRQFALNTREYVIEDHQIMMNYNIPPEHTNIKFKLPLNRPIKDLYWVIQRSEAKEFNDWFNYTNKVLDEKGTPTHIMERAQLNLNGVGRFWEPLDNRYLMYAKPYRAHRYIPGIDRNGFLYNYLFCIDPNALQHNGSMNATSFTEVVLDLTLYNVDQYMGFTEKILAGELVTEEFPRINPSKLPTVLHVFARSYNVLRIYNGCATLRYK